MEKRIKTPTILQMEATECGAASLAIILAYFGKYVPLEEMRVLCDVSRDGSNAANMLRAARNLGLNAEGYKVEIEHITSLKFPVVIHWQLNHFVVLEAIEKDHVYINDPASGRRKITWDEFDVSFTGIVLSFSPGPTFEPGGQPHSILENLHQLIVHSRLSVIYIMLASLMLAFPAILSGGFAKIFIDDILIRNQSNWISALIFAMILTALLQTALVFLQRYHLLRLQLKFVSSTTVTLLWHILHLPLRFFQQRFSGDISDRINANNRIYTLLSNEVSASIASLITLLLLSLILLLQDWEIGLLEIITTMGIFALFYVISEKMTSLSRLTLQEYGKLAGMAMNNIQLIEMIKASAMEQRTFERYCGQHARIISYQQKLSYYSQLLANATPTVSQFIFVIILTIGSLHILQGKLTIGGFVAIQVILNFFTQPLTTLLNFANNIQNVHGDFMRLNDVLNQEKDKRYLIHSEKTTPQQNLNLTIENLTFGYSPTQKALLTNVDLSANAGDLIALIGASGSGKSSLTKLICGLYEPWSGKIQLDKQLLEHISPIELATRVGYVDQDNYLFSGTLRDNLTLWHDEIPDEALVQALKDACIWEEVIERGGLVATIDEGGSDWSGGQRQRLEIARALVTHKPLLILDEATSAIDLALEKEILENIRKRHCTILVITHRLSAITEANQIYVLENGMIVEHGVHAQLIQRPDSVYRRLLQIEQD